MNERTLSPEDSSLDAFCLTHGLCLLTLQQAIERVEGKPGRRELERRLNRLRAAHHSKNLDAAEGWLYALVDGIKAVDLWIKKTSSKLAQEKTLVASRAEAADQARAEHERIRADYAELNAAGVRNIAKQLAAKYNRDVQDIRNIWYRRPKN